MSRNMSDSAASLSHATSMATDMIKKTIHAIYYVMDQDKYDQVIDMCRQVLTILRPLPYASASTDSARDQALRESPSSTVEQTFLVMSLLAHAYAKTGQKYQAVVTILQIFGISVEDVTTTTTTATATNTTSAMIFPELLLYIKYARYEKEGIKNDTSSSASGSGTKKSKKKARPPSSSLSTTVVNDPPASSSTNVESTWDWIDQLTIPPMIELPLEGTESSPVWLLSQQHESDMMCFYDPTIISTLAVTLNNLLKLPYSAFQIVTWAFYTVIAANPMTHPQNYDSMESFGHRAYMIGVGLLALLQFQHIQSPILTQLQVLALHMTRIQQQHRAVPSGPLNTKVTKYTSMLWAAQVAMWKYTLLPSSLSNINHTVRLSPHEQRQQGNVSLRLAESMALKCIDMYSVTYQEQMMEESKNRSDANRMDRYIQLSPTESYLLYVRTLQLQKKYPDVIQLVKDLLYKLDQNTGGTSSAATNHRYRGMLPRQTLLEIKVDALQHLLLEEEQDGGNTVVHDDPNSTGTILCRTLEELLHMFPDDWIYWQQYCDACCRTCRNNHVIHGTALTEVFRERILRSHPNPSKTSDDGNASFPYRGPQLLHVELALRRLLYCIEHEGEAQFQSNDSNRETYMLAFIESMVQYGDLWSCRATCTYSDLSPYLEQCIQHTSIVDQIYALLDWSKSMIRTNCVVEKPTEDGTDVESNPNPKGRQKQLRTYIFAVQVQFHILRHYYTTLQNSGNVEGLVTWEELVMVWQSFQASDSVDQAQMESRPADELIILAVQRLLFAPEQLSSPSQKALDLVIAATILESAMQYSPYNPHLKICAMHVLGDLEAPTMCWELYKGLSIKHIQHESCSYLILPILRSGGMFHEAVSVCREILGLHVSSAREVFDFMGRSMEAGNMTKAEEFLSFHRDKMTKSLTNLEAKGLILDMAPLLVNERHGILGVQQGIVGAETDFDRAKQMVSEAHNPNGVFSLLQMQGAFEDLKSSISDNRDFSVLSYEILWKRQFATTEIILSESLRRGHQHNLLIRAALCIEASKGPKKGKLVKPSLELQKRCTSLMNFADKTDDLCSTITPSLCNRPILFVMRELCGLIAALSSGIDSKGEFVLETLTEREDAVCIALQKAIESLQVVKANFTESSEVSTSRVCTMLADSIVSIFALFEMVAKIVDQFGWGKRKQKTKRCSAAVAEFASLFLAIIVDMRLVLEKPSSIVSLQDQTVVEQLPSVVDHGIFNATSSKVSQCREKTCTRIIIILNYVSSHLSSFESED